MLVMLGKRDEMAREERVETVLADEEGMERGLEVKLGGGESQPAPNALGLL